MDLSFGLTPTPNAAILFALVIAVMCLFLAWGMKPPRK